MSKGDNLVSRGAALLLSVGAGSEQSTARAEALADRGITTDDENSNISKDRSCAKVFATLEINQRLHAGNQDCS